MKKISIILITLLVTNEIIAQPNPGPGNQGSNISITNDGPTVPFDGGMSFLLMAVGVGLGVKRKK